MIVQVKIDDQNFTVEIVDIHATPVQALVDGESFDVWLERPARPAGEPLNFQARNQALPNISTSMPNPAPGANSNGNSDLIKAPIPGVILSIAIHPGDLVEKGQELCILEAMKMKNTIRSPRGGAVQTVHVTPGQTVSHGDLLLEFESSTAGEAEN